ncbi:hypothetical protein [Ornithinicoccus hortensis]|uniref:Uncharacterized protein n=1 Tax=Ornithinicoccus hortensis TaxID=82346 RepID=A0A542YQZ4_9MICO|nr:hypothetical protein [Ornithinicoccus hortensis]TQL50499.1 hypothetical protein FB467_1610 [Ornithinicoccus hortensis]
MDTAAAVPLSIERTLEGFFAQSRMLRHPAMWTRSHGVRRKLERYLDLECERFLTDSEKVLVHAERQLHSLGAVVRVAGPETLLHALPGFLGQRWLPRHPALARVQIMVVSEIVSYLPTAGILDRRRVACSILEVEAQVIRARQVLAEAADPT